MERVRSADQKGRQNRFNRLDPSEVNDVGLQAAIPVDLSGKVREVLHVQPLQGRDRLNLFEDCREEGIVVRRRLTPN
jgi:hypothetical protein